MSNLLLHCGAHSIDRNALAALPTPAPLGPRHFIRPYIDDVEIVEQALGEYGLRVEQEAFGVTHDGNRFFGIMETSPLEGEYLQKDYSVTIGLRGSWDQSMSRGLAVGSRVFVCDNLAFSGEVTFRTKQTLNVSERLPWMLRDAVARIPAMAAHQAQRFDAYKLTPLTQKQGDAAIIELVRRQIVTPSQVGRVVSEWDEPSHEEHAEDGYNVWRLHNAVTEALKPANRERLAIPAIWERTIPLTTFLDGVAGIH